MLRVKIRYSCSSRGERGATVDRWSSRILRFPNVEEKEDEARCEMKEETT